MSPTRQEIQEALKRRERAGRRGGKRRETEFILLIVVSIVAASGLTLTYQAKARSFPQVSESAANGKVLNLNSIRDSTQLDGILTDLQNANDRGFVAGRIVEASRKAHFPNVGALRTITVSQADLDGKDLPDLAKKVQAAAQNGRQRAPILTAAELRSIKPLLIVRTPGEFRTLVLELAAIFFVSFFAVHVLWKITAFAGDNLVLPTIELLCGIGLMMMLSLRDPLRDVLILSDFTKGIALGAVAMAALSLINYERTTRRFTWVFIALTVVLAVLLRTLGAGPGGSDVKVNLGFFQPVEVMRILIAFFLAGYFAENWELLRHLREKSGWLAQRLHFPRLDYVLPVLSGILASILLFAVLKDNGPALIVGAAFMMIYACARRRPSGAIAGFLLIVAAFWMAHHFHLSFTRTVADRIDMWRSPWRNTVAGGTQLAHALWSLASGGIAGAGPGLGSPSVIPAGYTDLILSVAGEEFGLIGMGCILALYGILLWRSFRTALNAAGTYSFFLVLGLSLVVVLQLILIAGGEFGVIPLSGVVSPFLSYGKTSMVANFAAFAVIVSVSARMRPGAQEKHFKTPIKWLAIILAAMGLTIFAKVGYVQTIAADDTLVRSAVQRIEIRGPAGDSGAGEETTRVAYSLAYNPRINEVLRLVGRGDIVDRHGVPLATSSWSNVEQHRDDYRRLGVDVEKTASRSESRHYPLGPEFFYLIGDVRAALQRDTFIERKSRARLEGFDDRRRQVGLEAGENGELLQYDGAELRAVLKERNSEDGSQPLPNVINEYDYRNLIPLVRHRNDPESSEMQSFLKQDRSVRMSIDAGFQRKTSAILKKHLEPQHKKGAVVVMDVSTGDLLAVVSYPWPEQEQFEAFRRNPDRQMLSDYLDRARSGYYTPGSSFKIVTAVAALNTEPDIESKVFACRRLGGGRVGNYVGKSTRPIRDDVEDREPHGDVTLGKGIVVSCNAYFAQLGDHLGSDVLFNTASRFGILVANPNTPGRLRTFLPQASYGQGEVRVTPFQMARVAATIGNGGMMPEGRWIIDESNPRTDPHSAILDPQMAGKLAGYMRDVVVSGTGKVLRTSPIPIAGKTGTAEVQGAPSHAWFIGFAPAGQQPGKRIAFAVLVENGRYGGTAAAPIAGEVVEAAREAGLL